MNIAQKSIVYVGGLEVNVTEEVLHAAFIPFGEIKTVQIPRDYQSNKHKGFGFVEFEAEEDAADAVENMEGSELFGKVIRCNIAKAMHKVAPGKAIWNDEEWIKSQIGAEDEDDAIPGEVRLLPSGGVDDEDDDDISRQ